MGIPEAQLATWSHQGAVATSALSYNSVRTAIEAHPVLAAKLAADEIKIYLQGSYNNDTNVRGSSDIDVIVELTAAFFYTFGPNTPESHKQLFQSHYPTNAQYGWAQFYPDVLAAITKHYGSLAVKEGNKSIKVAPANGRLPIDVIPCVQHKFFHQYNNAPGQYTTGIKFYTRPDGKEVVNYPEHHYSRGVELMRLTDNRYKARQRMIKNARDHAVDNNRLLSQVAPSYFLEGLISNVPVGHFLPAYRDSYFNIVDWLDKNLHESFTCQHGLFPLFGTAHGQWNIGDARKTIDALCAVWNNF